MVQDYNACVWEQASGILLGDLYITVESFFYTFYSLFAFVELLRLFL